MSDPYSTSSAFGRTYAEERAISTGQLLGQVMFLVAIALGFCALGTLLGRDLSLGTARLCSFAGFGMLLVSSFAGARFRVGAFGCDAEHRPELPEVARRRGEALLGTPVAGADVVVVGDTPADIACARPIGARSVGVASGRYSVGALARHDAAVVLTDLRDTDAAVAALLG